MTNALGKYVDAEIEKAEEYAASGNITNAFRHLERAHALGQANTFHHTRVHWRMLKIGWRRKDWREVFGQIIRIIGASTKTPVGIYPTGNTGGSNVWFFKPLPVPEDLQNIIAKSRRAE